MDTIVFKKMDPEHGYALLKKAYHKKRDGVGDIDWLIRESRVNGMLTVDFYGENLSSDEQERFGSSDDHGVTKDSMRFALTDEGWIHVGYQNIESVQQKMQESVTQDNADTFIDSFFEILEEKGFVKSNMLKPTAIQVSGNLLYGGYRMLSSGEESSEEGGKKRKSDNRPEKEEDKRIEKKQRTKKFSLFSSLEDKGSGSDTDTTTPMHSSGIGSDVFEDNKYVTGVLTPDPEHPRLMK